MKILVLSDIHGSLYYLNKVLNTYEQENFNYILILGDELYHGPRNNLPKDYNPKEVANLLNKYKNKILAIRGNCDSEVDQMLIEYPILSDYTIILLNNRKIFATHGHIYNKNNLPPLEKNDIFIYGHTHIFEAVKDNDIYFLNPGSISLAKNNNPNTYGVLDENSFIIKDLDGNIINFISFNS